MVNNDELNFELECDNLDEQFNNCCTQLKVLNLKFNNETKLKFYGLFKEATVGKSSENNKSISIFDFEEKYKYEAWKKCDIYSMQESKKLYIDLFKKLVVNHNPTMNENKSDSMNDLTNSAVFSSTATETRKEMEVHFNNLKDNDKNFFLLSNKFYQGDIITVDDLIKETVDLINYRDQTGQTILHTAVDSANLSAIKSLMDIGIAQKLINCQDDHLMTAMHIASINFEESIYVLLASFKPDITLKDKDGKTFIDYLKENEDLENFENYVKLV